MESVKSEEDHMCGIDQELNEIVLCLATRLLLLTLSACLWPQAATAEMQLVQSIEFPDGRSFSSIRFVNGDTQLVLGGRGNRVRYVTLWDVRTGMLVDEKSAGILQSMYAIWDADSATRLQTVDKVPNRIAFALSQDASQVAWIGTDQREYERSLRKLRRRYQNRRGGGLGMRPLMKPQKRLLHIMNLDTGTTMRSRRMDGNVLMRFSPDGKRLVAKSENAVYIWNTKDASQIHSFEDTRVLREANLELSPSGRFLCMVVAGSGEEENADQSELRIWDLKAGRSDVIAKLSSSSVLPPMYAFTGDGQALLFCDSHEVVDNVFQVVVRKWTIPQARVEAEWRLPANRLIRKMSVSPDGDSIAFVLTRFPQGPDAVPEESVEIWDLPSGQRVASGSLGVIIQLAFSSNSQMLATSYATKAGPLGADTGFVKVWKVR